MKINKIRIENFGKLSNYEVNFSDTLTVINQANGWGKTTLSAFIKAMFYGFVGTTKQKLSENERKKYKPWQGGVYGGYLDFDYDGKSYRIRRKFEAKESQDVFELTDLKTNKLLSNYPSGKKISDNPNRLGDEMFGVNIEGFERSVFINQNTLEMKKIESVTEKLNSLLGNTDESNNLKSAIALIDSKRSLLKNKQKKGLIPDTEENINNQTRMLDNLMLEVTMLEQNNVKLERLKEDISKHENAIKLLKQKLLKAQKNKEEKLISENISNLKNKVKDIEIELRKYKIIFNNQVPDYQKIVALEKNAAELKQIELLIAEHNIQVSGGENYDELNNFFGGQRVVKEEIDKLFGLNEKFVSLVHEQERVVAEHNAKISSEYNWPKTTGKQNFNKMFVSLALLTLIVSAALGFVNIIAGVVTGVVLLLVQLVVYLVLANKPGSINVQQTNAQYYKHQLQTVSDELEKYRSIIVGYLSKFYSNISNVEKSYFAYINTIQNNKHQLDTILAFKESKEDKKAELLHRRNVIDKTIKNILSEFYILEFDTYEDVVNELKRSYNNYDLYLKMLESAKHEYQEYVHQNSVSDVMPALAPEDISEAELSLANYQFELDELKETRAKLLADNEILSQSISNKSDIEEEISLNKDKLLVFEEQFDVLKLTEKYLKDAQDSITSQYLQPMHESFKKYSEIILHEDIGKFVLDTDLELKIEKFGETYNLDYYSKGYKDMLGIAMRLSLIDIMFVGQKPFVVLDDPFVHLDDQKLKHAVDLLKVLSKSMQVVYLTCHTSRQPK